MYVVCKSSKKAGYEFQDYCRRVCNLDTDQCYIVMYNRAWCKSYTNAVRHGKKQKRIQNFSKWPRGHRQKSCCTSHTKRHVSLFKHTVRPDDDQPIVLITAPTGSAAFQIGGSTIHSAFLLHNNYKSKPCWEKEK